VSSVSNQSKQMLELLKHNHISIGTTVQINKHFAFDGSVEIKVAQHNPCVLSEQVAKNILVHHE
jgi:DtxR family Mn-dependent transcriptional regulator